jgi:hypothetical protein
MDTPEMVRYTSGDMPEAMPMPEAQKKPAEGSKTRKWFVIPRDPDKVRALMNQPPLSMEELARRKAEEKGVSVPSMEATEPVPSTEVAPTEPAGELWTDIEEPQQMLKTEDIQAARKAEKVYDEAPQTLRSPMVGEYHEESLLGEPVGSVKGTRLETAASEEPSVAGQKPSDEEAPQTLRSNQLPPVAKAVNE